MLLLHRKQTTSAVCLTVLTDCAIPGNSFIIPASLDKIIPFSCADCIDMLSAFYVRVVLTVQRNCLFFIGIPGDSFVLPAKTERVSFFQDYWSCSGGLEPVDYRAGKPESKILPEHSIRFLQESSLFYS